METYPTKKSPKMALFGRFFGSGVKILDSVPASPSRM